MLDFVCADFEVPVRHPRSDVQKAVGYQNTEFEGKDKAGKTDLVVISTQNVVKSMRVNEAQQKRLKSEKDEIQDNMLRFQMVISEGLVMEEKAIRTKQTEEGRGNQGRLGSQKQEKSEFQERSGKYIAKKSRRVKTEFVL